MGFVDFGVDARPATEAEKNRRKLAEIIESDSIRDILKMTFGDHTKITITRDGITSEEYDHD